MKDVNNKYLLKLNKEILQEKLIYFFIFLICSLIFLRDVILLPINKVIFLGLYGIAFLLLESKNIILIMIFTVPFFNGLPGNYILLLAIITLMLKKDFKLTFAKVSLPITILCAELYHSLFYNANVSTIMDIFRYMTYIIFICFVIFDRHIKINYRKCLRMFSLGVIFMCIIIFCTTLKYYPLETISNGTFRYGDLTGVGDNGEMVLKNNQNNIGYYCALAISVLLLLNTCEKPNRIINFISIIIVVIFGILTMSRAFLLTSIGITFLYYLLISNNAFKLLKNSIISITILLILIFLLNCIFPNVVIGIVERFQEVDISNGRSGIFQLYNQFLFENTKYFLEGMGIFGMHIISGVSVAPHNGFQQIVLSYGIIGFIIFTIFFINVVNISRLGMKRIPIVSYLPFICMIIYIQSIQFIYPFELMLPFIVCVFSIRMKAEASNKSKCIL